VECILHLYEKFGTDRTANQLDGVFAFCLVDSLNRKVVLARDPFGVRPMFRMTGPNGLLGICSEAKGIFLPQFCIFKTHLLIITGLISLMEGGGEWRMDPFPPGHFEEYELDLDGKARLIRQQQFYKIGDAPNYKLALLEAG